MPRRKKPVPENIIEETHVTDDPSINSFEVVDKPVQETPSLKERIFGTPDIKPKRQPRTKKPRGKEIDVSLMSKVLPSVIAATIATYSKKLIKAPYKDCAPTQQEVQSVIGPIFNILARRVEIVGQASEDMIDMINCLVASFVAGIRIHITFLTIQELKHGHDGTNEQFKSYSNTTNERNSEQVVPNIGSSGDDRTESRNGNSNTEDSDSEHARREAEKFANLFREDLIGRKRLGII